MATAVKDKRKAVRIVLNKNIQLKGDSGNMELYGPGSRVTVPLLFGLELIAGHHAVELTPDHDDFKKPDHKAEVKHEPAAAATEKK